MAMWASILPPAVTSSFAPGGTKFSVCEVAGVYLFEVGLGFWFLFLVFLFGGGCFVLPD